MNNSNAIIDTAKSVISKQAAAVKGLIPQLSSDFEKIVVWAHNSKGRIVLTGIGKSAIVGMKISATLNSTGTKSIFMHAADAIHGDLGMIEKDDIVICLSKSGATPEIKTLVPLLRDRGSKLVGMTSNPDSYLAQQSDAILHVGIEKEADPNNLAPTTSTTVQLVLGDALAICLMELSVFKPEDFARFHPGGALGKALYLQLQHLLHQNKKPAVNQDASISEVITEISTKLVGATTVLDNTKKIVGIITDGDLRRMMQNHSKFDVITAKDIMSKNPCQLDHETLAKDALLLMQQKSISQVVVKKSGEYFGIVHMHDILNEGIY